MKRKGDEKRKWSHPYPPLLPWVEERKQKKMCSFLNTFGRIEERKEGEELEKIGYGGLLD